MIATIKGEVLFTDASSVVIECGGVGFRVFATTAVLGSAVVGTEIFLYTYMQVKEDGISLFGFASMDEKMLFEQLIGVSGVGPKGAMSILSFMGADNLRFAVVSADAKAIAKSPGVGAKTAQKIILELKDKVNLEETLSSGIGSSSSAGSTGGTGAFSIAETDAYLALCALGYGQTQALEAVKEVGAGDGVDSDEILRQALKKLL